MNGGRLLKEFRAPEGVVKVYENGFVESDITEGAYIDEPYLIEGKKLLEEALKGEKCYVLSTGAGHFRITKKARQLSSSAAYSSHLAAVAILTAQISIKLMVDLYNKLDKPPVITRSFTDRDDAIRWLNEMKARHSAI